MRYYILFIRVALTRLSTLRVSIISRFSSLDVNNSLDELNSLKDPLLELSSLRSKTLPVTNYIGLRVLSPGS